MGKMTAQQLAQYFDHTQLKAFAVDADFKKLCDESRAYGFAMVAINSVPVALCKKLLADSDVHVGAAIGFPLGQQTIATKVFETRDAIANGCDEIDYVINVGQLKMGNLTYIEDEMRQIVNVCQETGVISKVIFENCYLNDNEKRAVAEIALRVKPDFIKTSTGFGTGGATLEDVRLMKSVVGYAVKVKASGGVRDLPTTLAMIDAGAERIGSSSSVAIVDAYKQTL